MSFLPELFLEHFIESSNSDKSLYDINLLETHLLKHKKALYEPIMVQSNTRILDCMAINELPIFWPLRA